MKQFLPFILIAVTVGMYYMYISPLYGDVQMLSAKKEEYLGTLAKARELKAKRDELLAQYNAISQDDVTRLKRIIPDTANSVDMVTNINALAAQYGMIIRGVKITDSKPQDNSSVATAPVRQVALPYKTVQIAFTVSGSYDQFTRFLKDLESNVHLFDVNMLAIKLDNKAPSGNSIFEYSLEVRTYSLH